MFEEENSFVPTQVDPVTKRRQDAYEQKGSVFKNYYQLHCWFYMRVFQGAGCRKTNCEKMSGLQVYKFSYTLTQVKRWSLQMY